MRWSGHGAGHDGRHRMGMRRGMGFARGGAWDRHRMGIRWAKEAGHGDGNGHGNGLNLDWACWFGGWAWEMGIGAGHGNAHGDGHKCTHVGQPCDCI